MVMITLCMCDLGLDSTENAQSCESVLGRGNNRLSCCGQDRATGNSVPLLPGILHRICYCNGFSKLKVLCISRTFLAISTTRDEQRPALCGAQWDAMVR